jgi:hypothetical protein
MSKTDWLNDVIAEHNASVVAARNPEEKRELTQFLAVGHGCWGRGDSIRAAIKVAREQGAGRNVRFAVWKVTEGTQVDGMGYLCYQQDDHEPVNLGIFDYLGRAK